MILSKELKKENILLDIKSSNKWDLLDEMVNLVAKNKEINPKYKDKVLTLLKERENSMTTGIGNGVAIPHCNSSLIQHMTIALAISKKGIDFKSIDNAPAKIIILLLVPDNKLSQHIKILAKIAKIMATEEFRQKIIKQKDQDSILKIIKEYSNK